MRYGVEIFVLSYNRVGYLSDCLRSILAQTFRDFSVTVLDNASTQDVTSVVKSFDDERLRLIINPVNIGFTANWKQAYDLASAEYMMIFFDDDTMSPRLLECQIRLFREYPNLSFVSTSANLVFNDAKMLNFQDDDKVEFEIFRSPGELLEAIFKPRVFGFGSILYRTRIAKQFQFDSGRFGSIADRPYMLTLTRLGPSARLIRPTHNARLHPTQDSELRHWTYMNEIELGRFYLEIGHETHRLSLRRSVIKRLAHFYALRRPRTPLGAWLKALKDNHMLEWRVLLPYLPYYLIRNALTRRASQLMPTLYQRYVQARARRP